MRIAQSRQIGTGIKSRFTNESVKRTPETEDFTDFSGTRNPRLGFQPSASRTESIARSNPAINRWAIFTSSAPADEMHATFWAKHFIAHEKKATRFEPARPALLPATSGSSPSPNCLRASWRLTRHDPSSSRRSKCEGSYADRQSDSSDQRRMLSVFRSKELVSAGRSPRMVRLIA